MLTSSVLRDACIATVLSTAALVPAIVVGLLLMMCEPWLLSVLWPGSASGAAITGVEARGGVEE